MTNGNWPILPVATSNHRADDLGIPMDPLSSENDLVAPTDLVRSLVSTSPHALAAGRPPHLTASDTAPTLVPVTSPPTVMFPRVARIGVEATMLPAGLVGCRLAPRAMAFTKGRPENPVTATLFTAAAGALVPSLSPIAFVTVSVGKGKTAVGARHGRIGGSRCRQENAARQQG